VEENEYDSEFEEEFFGKKDKDLNKELGNLPSNIKIEEKEEEDE
jgi:hypothetical protein